MSCFSPAIVVCGVWCLLLADVAVYGQNGNEAKFPAVNCQVTEAHKTIECSTTPGAGFDIGWTLTIGNQTSQSPVTSYR